MNADKLQALADRATALAAELRALADETRVAERNAGIEATGKVLRRLQWRSRVGVHIREVLGYWADGHGWDGRREFIPADGSESMYLFDDEIIEDDSAAT